MSCRAGGCAGGFRTAGAAWLITLMVTAVSRGEHAAGDWAEDLRAEDAASWRVAQVQLARAGAVALLALEPWAAQASDAEAARLRGVVELMLRKSVDEDDLRAHARIHALCAPEIAKARAATAPLLECEMYDDGSAGLVLVERAGEVIGTDRRAVKAAIDMGGFAVPAAVDLCRSEHATARLYGLEILGALDATSQRALVAAMEEDDATAPALSGCIVAPRSIARAARYVRRERWPFRNYGAVAARPPVPDEAREYVLWLDERLDVELFRTLEDHGIPGSATWDEYWRQVRAVLAGEILAVAGE